MYHLALISPVAYLILQFLMLISIPLCALLMVRIYAAVRTSQQLFSLACAYLRVYYAHMKDRNRFEMRVTPSDRRMLVDAAKAAGLPLCAWIRSRALAAAVREAARRAKEAQKA